MSSSKDLLYHFLDGKCINDDYFDAKLVNENYNYQQQTPWSLSKGYKYQPAQDVFPVAILFILIDTNQRSTT